MFYALVLVICLLIGAFVTVGALVSPDIAAIGVVVLLALPFAGMLVRDIVAGEMFNPLVACIAAVVVVPILCLPPHAVAVALLSLWGILVVALAGKTAWIRVRRPAPGPEAHGPVGGQTLE